MFAARKVRGLSAGRGGRGGETDGGLDDAFGDGVPGETSDVMNVQLVHDLLAVLFDGLDADVEFGGNLFVGLAFGDKLKDFASRVVRRVLRRRTGPPRTKASRHWSRRRLETEG